jgi:radical SAM superfamily enzyme
MSTYNVILFTDIITNYDNILSLGIGPYKLANTLRKSGYSCLVVHHTSKFTVDEIYKLLDATVSDKTYLIGFSTTFYNYNIRNTKNADPLEENFNLFPQGSEFDDQIFCHIKRLNNKIKIAVGGPMINADFKCKYADFLVLGYAEANIVNLVDHVKDRVPLKDSYRNINNNKIIIKNVMAEGYEFTTDSMTWLPEDVVNHTILPIEIGRGCIFSCAFCSFPMNGKQKLDFVKESEIIADELLYNFNNYGITQYYIVDDTFNDSVDKLIQLREVMIGLPFKPEFWCYARLDLICTHPDTMQMLYDIGIRKIMFGIETLDRKSGLAIGKGYSREKQIAMISHIKETYPEIHMHGSFIIGAPYESEESIRRTLDALISHEIKLDSVAIRPLMIGKRENGLVFESKITKDYEKFGYREVSNKHPFVLLWENDELDFAKARELANMFQKNYKQISNTSLWHIPINHVNPILFFSEYKKRLFELVGIK